MGDEVRRRAHRGLRRKRHQGPRTRVVSRRHADGRVMNFVEFIGCEPPDFLQAPASSGTLRRFVVPTKPCCVVTGLPGRYRDPLTGFPFASAAAFAKIRADYASAS